MVTTDVQRLSLNSGLYILDHYPMSSSFHEVTTMAARTHSMSFGTCTLYPPQSLVTPACDQGNRVRMCVEASVNVIMSPETIATSCFPHFKSYIIE